MKVTEKDLINSLNRSLNSITPDVYKNIKKEIKKERVIDMKKKFNWLLATAITTCFILIVLGGSSYYLNNYKVDSLISIDVNPSLEVYVNKKQRVIKVNALNDGGKKILDNMDLKGIPLNIAINALTGSMVEHGYLTGDDANILITVQNDNNNIKTLIDDSISNALIGSSVNANILNQTIDNQNNDTKKLATDNNISYGKALFIEQLLKKDNTLNASELSTMSIREISNLINEKNINISDIVDNDDDDSDLEKIEDAIEDLDEESMINDTTKNLISKDKAKKIALDHAGVNVSNVTIKLTLDDGIAVYDVEFKTSSKEYDYEINATTGKIIDYEIELIKNNNDEASNYLTESKIKEIVLNHANVKDVNFIKIVLDTDDNIKVYEVEFIKDGYEYDYEVNAITGSIIEFDKELDD